MKTVLLGLHPQKSYRESWKQSEKYHNYAWNLLPHTCTTCETTASYLMWFVQKLQPLEFACRASSPSSPFSKMPDRLLICCHFCSSPQRIQEIRRRKPFASSVKTLTTSMFLRFRVLWRETSIFTCSCIDSVDLSVRLGSDCYHSCPDRTYSVDDTMVCAPCEDKNCVICDPSQCYFCEEGFYVFGNNWSIYDFIGVMWISADKRLWRGLDRVWRCTPRSWHQE